MPRGIPFGDTNQQKGVWRRVDLHQTGESHFEILTCPGCSKQVILNSPEKPDKTSISPEGILNYKCPFSCEYTGEIQLAGYEGKTVYRPQDDKEHPAFEKAKKVKKAKSKKPKE